MHGQAHWENVYSTKQDNELSWTESDPRRSFDLIRQVCPSGRVIDVGAGTSRLCDRLLNAGGYSVTALDVSASALDRSRARLGARAENVRWIVADVTAADADADADADAAAPNIGIHDLWHDRAVFHFLTRPSDRAAYAALLKRSVPVGGHVIIATFALDGPEKCSGLPVQRYDGRTLARELGAGLALLQSQPDIHVTPWGKPQSFNYAVFVRVEAAADA
jgi:SAM-dependent methyltransferase